MAKLRHCSYVNLLGVIFFIGVICLASLLVVITRIPHLPYLTVFDFCSMAISSLLIVLLFELLSEQSCHLRLHFRRLRRFLANAKLDFETVGFRILFVGSASTLLLGIVAVLTVGLNRLIHWLGGVAPMVFNAWVAWLADMGELLLLVFSILDLAIFLSALTTYRHHRLQQPLP